MTKTSIVLTILGEDRPGLVEQIAQVAGVFEWPGSVDEMSGLFTSDASSPAAGEDSPALVN